MSTGHEVTHPAPQPHATEPAVVMAPDLTAWLRPALIAAAAGLSVCVLGGVFQPPAFFRAYLVGFMLCVGVPLGCMALLMISRLTGGRWADQLRPVLESAVLTLPVLAVVFVPLALGLGLLYPWARPDFFGDHPLLQNKAIYLSVPFFLIRAAIYFIVWSGLGLLLVRGMRRLGPTPSLEAERRLRAISAVGLGLYGLTITLAAIDWTMSLEPEWFSTIYGVMLAMGQLLAGMAFAVAVTVLPAANRPGNGSPSRQVLNDMGNLMLAFTMLWAYMAFSQYLLIYAGNLPEEVPWYLARLRNGWQWVALMVLLFQFALPFALFLSRDIKRDPRKLACVALLALAMRPVDLTWVIAAAYPAEGWLALVLIPFAVIGLGGLWLALFVRQLRLAPPVHMTLVEGHGHG